jgi:hypothetical protein
MREIYAADLTSVMNQLAYADCAYYHGGFLIAQKDGADYHVNTETGDWTRVTHLAPAQPTSH